MKKITLKLAFIATVFGLSTFSAMATAPQVDSVASVIGITSTTAFSGCYVINTATPKTNPDSIAERGVCVNTAGNPVITDTKFASYKSIAATPYEPCVLSGLTANTHYYIKAYATNVGGETSYSAQKEFTTAANDIEATWTCKANMNATTTGSISATAMAVDKFMSGAISYDQNSGGNGTTTILFPSPTGLAKFTATTLNPAATFSPNYYTNFSITANTAYNVKNIVLTAMGYKTGSLLIKIAYSFDNFATADTLSTVKYNDATRTSAVKSASLVSANPALNYSMGRENISFPCNIVVGNGQTIAFRMYIWGKIGSGILMKNLIVSGTTDLGTGVRPVNSASGQLKLISTNNELKIENAANFQQLDILSVNGKMLRSFKNSKSEIQLSTNDLQSGLYIVRAYTESGLQTGKFIK